MSDPLDTDGERWTEDRLTRLRAARWRPGALLGFLVAAQSRANATRCQRPALARQERIWVLAGAASWLLLGRLGPRGVFHRVQSTGLLWWAGCAVMLDWHLGMVETPEGDPVALAGPDALTLLRAWLVPAVAEAGDPRLVLIGALSDLGDGRLARSTRCTRFGRDLEGLVDACFVLAALRGAEAAGNLAPWAARVERGRLAVGTGHAAWVYFATGRAPDRRVAASGRPAAPLRTAALIAAGLGQRRLAARLLLAGAGVATASLLSSTRIRPR